MDKVVKILSVERLTGTSQAGNDYEYVEVNYKESGKTAETTRVFGNSELAPVFEDMEPGTIATLTFEKNGKFWNVSAVEIGRTTTSKPAAVKGKTVSPPLTKVPTKPYVDTGEADKQVMIVRQSCLARAIETLNANKDGEGFQPDEAIKIAEEYTQWVIYGQAVNETAKTSKKADFSDMEDDIPY